MILSRSFYLVYVAKSGTGLQPQIGRDSIKTTLAECQGLIRSVSKPEDRSSELFFLLYD